VRRCDVEDHVNVQVLGNTLRRYDNIISYHINNRLLFNLLLSYILIMILPGTYFESINDMIKLVYLRIIITFEILSKVSNHTNCC